MTVAAHQRSGGSTFSTRIAETIGARHDLSATLFPWLRFATSSILALEAFFLQREIATTSPMVAISG